LALAAETPVSKFFASNGETTQKSKKAAAQKKDNKPHRSLDHCRGCAKIEVKQRPSRDRFLSVLPFPT
jgi:hypothetical protein